MDGITQAEPSCRTFRNMPPLETLRNHDPDCLALRNADAPALAGEV